MFERRVWAGAAREATSFAILLQVVDKSVRVDRVMSYHSQRWCRMDWTCDKTGSEQSEVKMLGCPTCGLSWCLLVHCDCRMQAVGSGFHSCFLVFGLVSYTFYLPSPSYGLVLPKTDACFISD